MIKRKKFTPTIEPVYVRFGIRVKQLREFLGYTQEEFSQRLNFGRAQLASIETGRSRVLLHQVDAIAKAFHSKSDRLMRDIWGAK